MAPSSAIREAQLRARAALARKPAAALHADSTAVVVWEGGLGTRMRHPLGVEVRTDMPAELGGGGAGPTPGWYFRAGVAACMATCIAMEAALREVALTRLEVEAHSESDARGMLGDPAVPAGPLRFRLQVTIEAEGASPAQLRELVAAADARAPMSSCLRQPPAITLDLRLPAAATA